MDVHPSIAVRAQKAKTAEEVNKVIYEVREYIPAAGRFRDVVDLFTSVVVPLFRKHGMEMTQVGCTTIGDNSFNEVVYTMRFSDLAELERKWGTFLADPDWASALASREENGPLYQAIRRRVIESTPFEGVLDHAV
ncbi:MULTISPECIES: NIPSNAP family protein [Amycolatopsis]|uniref:NIPSNAP protein n=1 Tax=Amycolatopsis echigonensis TaxID=2576905 RepID=A0A2N3WNC6_9PSEU|nr:MULTISPECIES: NIPSNAP family protein [Amycolatopsis]PKV95369.1 NIPSNAP protein [Amycolatopsis niigatensis]